MSDTLENIPIPINEWVDLYALASIEVGIALSVENVGVCDVYLAVQAAKPDLDVDPGAYNVLQRNNGVRLQNNAGDLGAWAYCQSNGAKINVMPDGETGFLPHIKTTSVGNGILDTNNSSTTPLPADTGGIDHIFTGVATPALDFVESRVATFSDVASATDGLRVQYSMDGDNWDHEDPYTVPAGKGKNYQVQRVAGYYRIVYTNGTVAQTAFRLSTILNRVHSQQTSHRVDDEITTDDDSSLQKSIIMTATNDPKVYRNADVQNPLAMDGDSVYQKDLDIFFCTAADFIKDADPTISEQNVINSMVSDIYIEKLNSTPDAVKTVFLQFKRPVLTSSFGINAGPGGDFSNTKITVAQGDATFVVFDDSADSTKHEIFLFPILPVKFSRMTIEFFTTDPVSIGLIGIFKNIEVAARLQAISDLTQAVEDIGSFRGAINVNTALVHRQGVNEYFKRNTGPATTIAIAATSGDTDINVVSGAALTVGNLVRISNSTIAERGHFLIKNIAVNVVTLNRQIDNDLEIGDDVTEIDISMTDVGTLTSPIAFRIEPPGGLNPERWQITRLLITMLDGTSMDDGKFGGIPPLPNGFVLRVIREGVTSTVTYWRTNQDLKDDMFNVEYAPKAPAGQFGLNGRWTITASEFVADLDGANGDYAEGLVQDDHSDLLDFKIKAQGRLFGG